MRKERYVARLDHEERAVVLALLAQTREIVEPPALESSGDAFDDLVRSVFDASDDAVPDAESDPALRRLLPEPHVGDPVVAAEFRRLSSRSIRDAKASRLDAAATALSTMTSDSLSLDEDEAHAFVAALTDVRLVMADRLGVVVEGDVDALEDLSDDDPRAVLASYYDFCSWLQETLSMALLSRLS